MLNGLNMRVGRKKRTIFRMKRDGAGVVSIFTTSNTEYILTYIICFPQFHLTIHFWVIFYDSVPFTYLIICVISLIDIFTFDGVL